MSNDTLDAAARIAELEAKLEALLTSQVNQASENGPGVWEITSHAGTNVHYATHTGSNEYVRTNTRKELYAAIGEPEPAE